MWFWKKAQITRKWHRWSVVHRLSTKWLVLQEKGHDAAKEQLLPNTVPAPRLLLTKHIVLWFLLTMRLPFIIKKDH